MKVKIISSDVLVPTYDVVPTSYENAPIMMPLIIVQNFPNSWCRVYFYKFYALHIPFFVALVTSVKLLMKAYNVSCDSFKWTIC
jgi:hypothetical protein